jgi:predicted Fe-Mo cluster-binding NifX family protein
MIIAIPASADKTDALIDERFGRCHFFCFYDTLTGNHNFQKNSMNDAGGGVGLQVAEFLSNKGVDEVYAVEVGPKAEGVLNRLKIKINPVDSGQSVAKIIDMLNHKD